MSQVEPSFLLLKLSNDGEAFPGVEPEQLFQRTWPILLAEYHGGRITSGQQELLPLSCTPDFADWITLWHKSRNYNLEMLGELSRRFKNWLATR